MGHGTSTITITDRAKQARPSQKIGGDVGVEVEPGCRLDSLVLLLEREMQRVRREISDPKPGRGKKQPPARPLREASSGAVRACVCPIRERLRCQTARVSVTAGRK